MSLLDDLDAPMTPELLAEMVAAGKARTERRLRPRAEIEAIWSEDERAQNRAMNLGQRVRELERTLKEMTADRNDWRQRCISLTGPVLSADAHGAPMRLGNTGPAGTTEEVWP